MKLKESNLEWKFYKNGFGVIQHATLTHRPSGFYVYWAAPKTRNTIKVKKKLMNEMEKFVPGAASPEPQPNKGEK